MTSLLPLAGMENGQSDNLLVTVVTNNDIIIGQFTVIGRFG